MKVLISGSTGLVGKALVPGLERLGCTVRPLLRERSEDRLWWQPETGELNSALFNTWRPDVLVHLAGENIAAGRWSADRKRRIRTSRVEATERLVQALLNLEHPIDTFISASAIGIYGSRGDEVMTEESSPGDDFLSEVAVGWEQAANPLTTAGVRVIQLRFGMILSKTGGALAKMLPLFRLGLGGRLGTGQQWVSWIALHDVIALVCWAIENTSAYGAYNAVAPNPVCNVEFTEALAKALRRPAVFPAPASMLRLAFGEMADAVLLSSVRAYPQRLLNQGFVFEVSRLEDALRRELKP